MDSKILLERNEAIGLKCNFSHYYRQTKIIKSQRIFQKNGFKKFGQATILKKARKIAIILWNNLSDFWSIVAKKQPYVPQTTYSFLDDKNKQINRLRK